jgi:redox-sensitive bicupin YhaK (pirin superfamily)
MDRKNFIKNAVLGLGAATIAPSVSAEKNLNKPEIIPIIGFERLPKTNKPLKMKTILHKAATRGKANHGWLNSHHTFSFANYYDPSRMHFGALRVLNDDIIDGASGFGTHPHNNMEIISILIYGALEHKDSMGNTAVIKENEVQIMSAGTGIYHSEYNHSKTADTNFLQIWVFPKEKNITPRYDQKQFLPTERRNKLQVVVSPEKDEAVDINQDAWFYLGNLDKGFETNYKINKAGNGVYVFVIKGDVTIGDEKLNTRDGLGVWETDNFSLKADSDAEVLLMEVPMNV